MAATDHCVRNRAVSSNNIERDIKTYKYWCSREARDGRMWVGEVEYGERTWVSSAASLVIPREIVPMEVFYLFRCLQVGLYYAVLVPSRAFVNWDLSACRPIIPTQSRNYRISRHYEMLNMPIPKDYLH
jgi:hypothetical protein